MPKPSKRMRNFGQRDSACVEMGYRELQVRASSLNIDDRSINADVSTETPVLMPDFQRMELVPEILVSSGAVIPGSRQVPFLDSHQRSSVANQLGSARDVATSGNKITARLHFSTAADGEFTKVREGHVTDVSAGYQIIKKQYVPAGETKNIDGRSYKGPANVVTKWRLLEVSLTPIGADQQAKLRGLDPDMVRFLSPDERFEMNKKLRALLVSRGMDAGLDDEAAQQWAVDNADKLAGDKRELPGSPTVTPEIQKLIDDAVSKSRAANPVDTKSIIDQVTEATRKAFEAEEKRRSDYRSEVDSLCQLAGLPDQAEHCRSLADIAAVKKFLTDEQAKRAETLAFTPSIRVSKEGRDGFISELKTALSMRAIDNVASPHDPLASPDQLTKRRELAREQVFPVAGRTKGYERWRNASVYDLAHEYVRTVYGIDTRFENRENIAIIAMFGPQRAADMGIEIRSSGAYHTPGSFANLTLDAVNKSMMLGYVEAQSTWEGPMRRAASVPDFKNINRLRLGAIPNLPVWNDNSDPEKASFADAKETYAVEARSISIDYSYRLLVNDDMDALSRSPGQLGSAARRTVNAVAWAQVTSNPTMSDGKALFLETAAGNRKRSNLTTGSAAPTTATLQTMADKMMQMRGENTPEGAEGADILSLMPRYIVGPGALLTTIRQLVLSVYDPADAYQKFNTAAQLIPVIEPLLDAASTTAWYTFADTSQIDTVEVAFLQGQENPLVRPFLDEKRLCQTYTILQTFAAKAMNHRGMQKHNGA